MSYKQLTPAKDWYFVSYDNQDQPIAQRIAVWAECEDGSIVGLIPFYNPTKEEAVLIGVPRGGGCYLHKEQLTDAELESTLKL